MTNRRLQRYGASEGVLTTGDARTLEVVARLRHGVLTPDVFPLPLDGILAGVSRRSRLASSFGSVVDHHVETLPLAATFRGPRNAGLATKARWVWAATCARWPVGTETEVRHVHRRGWSERAATMVGIQGDDVPAATDIGRWKAWRLPSVATLAAELRWVCLGDPDGVRALLDRVDGIGKKVNIGEGVVIDWTVTDAGPADWSRIWWHDDGTIARPVPARHAADLGVPDADTVPWFATRPPYWRPPLGERGVREVQEVIAPWTQRPSDSTAV